jgi:hypothetical protein
MGVRSALRAGHLLHPAPGRFLVLISVRGIDDPRATVRLEGLGRTKKKSTSSGLKPATFQACSIVSEPTTLPRLETGPEFIYFETAVSKQIYTREKGRTDQIQFSTESFTSRLPI